MESTENAGTQTPASYKVGELYKKSWELVKKNYRQLAIITLIGVIVNVAISAFMVFVVVNKLVDDAGSAIVSGIIASSVAILAGVFVGLLQIIAIKRLRSSKEIDVSSVVHETTGLIGRALSYGAFVVLVMIGSAVVITLLTRAVGPLGVLAGLAFIVATVIAIFRYAFVQFVIVEPQEMKFLDRFKKSEALTKNIYGTLVKVWLMAIVLTIGGAIIGAIISAPFKSKPELRIRSQLTIVIRTE